MNTPEQNDKKQEGSAGKIKRLLALAAACAIAGCAVAALILAVTGAPFKTVLGLIFLAMAVPFVIFVLNWITGLIRKGRNKEL